MVRIQLLGPLRAWREGDELELGGPQQLAVLGLLATYAAAGSVMSPAELIDALWEEHPPASGYNVIQTYLKRLRRLLEPDRPPNAPSRLLPRVGGGHTLALPTVEVDLVAFRRLISASIDAERNGDRPRAAQHVGEALQLWKGAPLSNVPLLGNHPAVVALSGERWAAVARYGETMLAIGKASEALPMLEQAAAACPLDEAAHARLIRTYRAIGNRGQAFATYHTMRDRLADELGVDPGPELAAAHLALFQDDPLRTPEDNLVTDGADLPAAVAAVKPAQLPVTTGAFVGRAEQLRQLDKLVSARPTGPDVAISAIVGTAGIGKTTLAVHWAYQVADQFPDGQLFVNLRGFGPSGSAMSPAEALRALLEALHVPPQRIPTSQDAQAGLYRSLLAGRRILIVLDNALNAEQVRPLLPGSSCLVLVTSRNQLTGLVTEAARPLNLDLLSADEARGLLIQRLGIERVAADPQATDRIVERCGGLPLALAIVAANAATHPHFPLAVLADELRRPDGDLDGFATGEPSTDLRAVFSRSYQALGSGAKRLFRLLAVHPGPELTLPAAASLAGIPVARVRPLLAELTRAHLLAEATPGRFVLHDLLRAYATELVHGPDYAAERQEASRRVLDHYVHTAHTAALLLEPSRAPTNPEPARAGVTPEPLADHVRAKAWLDVELAVLRAALGMADETRSDQHAWQLAWSLSGYLDWRGRWQDNVAVQLIALDAAVRLDDAPTLARAHQNLACALGRLERFDDAVTHFQHALERFGQLGEPLGQAFVHRNLAVLEGQRQRHRAALEHQQQALGWYETAGHQIGHARTLAMTAWTYSYLGDNQQALAIAKQALAVLTESEDRYGQGWAWGASGHTHQSLGNHAEALDSYRSALRLFQDVGERQQEAETLAHIGDVHDALGDSRQAATAWRRALTILEEIGHPETFQVRAKLRGLTG